MRILPYDNYWCQIEFSSDKERELLNKAVSYEIPGGKFMPSYNAGFTNGTKSFLTQGNKLPLRLMKSIFPENKLVYDKEFIDLSFDDIPLYKNIFA